MDFKFIDDQIKKNANMAKNMAPAANGETFYTRRNNMNADINMVRFDKEIKDKINAEDEDVLKKYDELELHSDVKAWINSVKQKANRQFDGSADRMFKATNVDRNIRLKNALEKDFEGISGRSVGKRMKKVRRMNTLAGEMNRCHAQIDAYARQLETEKDTMSNINKLKVEEKVFALRLKMLEQKKEYQHEFIKAYGKKDKWEEERLAQVEAEYLISKSKLYYLHKEQIKSRVGKDENEAYNAEQQKAPKNRSRKVKDKNKEYRVFKDKLENTYKDKYKAASRSAALAVDKYYNGKMKKNSIRIASLIEGKDDNKRVIRDAKNLGKNSGFTDMDEDAFREFNEKELGGPVFRNFMLQYVGIDESDYKNKVTHDSDGNRVELTERHVFWKINDARSKLPQAVEKQLDKAFKQIEYVEKDGVKSISPASVINVCREMAGLVDSIYGAMKDEKNDFLQLEKLKSAVLAWVGQSAIVSNIFLDMCYNEKNVNICDYMKTYTGSGYTDNPDKEMRERWRNVFRGNRSADMDKMPETKDRLWDKAVLSYIFADSGEYNYEEMKEKWGCKDEAYEKYRATNAYDQLKPSQKDRADLENDEEKAGWKKQVADADAMYSGLKHDMDSAFIEERINTKYGIFVNTPTGDDDEEIGENPYLNMRKDEHEVPAEQPVGAEKKEQPVGAEKKEQPAEEPKEIKEEKKEEVKKEIDVQNIQNDDVEFGIPQAGEPDQFAVDGFDEDEIHASKKIVDAIAGEDAANPLDMGEIDDNFGKYLDFEKKLEDNDEVSGEHDVINTEDKKQRKLREMNTFDRINAEDSEDVKEAKGNGAGQGEENLTITINGVHYEIEREVEPTAKELEEIKNKNIMPTEEELKKYDYNGKEKINPDEEDESFEDYREKNSDKDEMKQENVADHYEGGQKLEEPGYEESARKNEEVKEADVKPEQKEEAPGLTYAKKAQAAYEQLSDKDKDAIERFRLNFDPLEIDNDGVFDRFYTYIKGMYRPWQIKQEKMSRTDLNAYRAMNKIKDAMNNM